MAVPDKLTKQAAGKLGEPVDFATMVIPPGATLYKTYSRGPSKAGSIAGPLAEAISSKSGPRSEGTARRFPRQMGVLAVTADRLVFHKKRSVGVGCGDEITSWPRDEIKSAEFDEGAKGRYPGLVLTFADDSTVAIFGEKRWNLAGLADALTES